ncbi:hypothetical protein M885DRAFT_507397 [Pelagophyceae sp. CCMP2097]|nr:hypothetical protein M885DRAFT_507397 [Pelagophyceae sp. CCMP2097]
MGRCAGPGAALTRGGRSRGSRLASSESRRTLRSRDVSAAPLKRSRIVSVSSTAHAAAPSRGTKVSASGSPSALVMRRTCVPAGARASPRQSTSTVKIPSSKKSAKHARDASKTAKSASIHSAFQSRRESAKSTGGAETDGACVSHRCVLKKYGSVARRTDLRRLGPAPSPVVGGGVELDGRFNVGVRGF